MRVDRALRDITVQKHLTQAELCRRTGISSGHMSMYFTNKVRQPRVDYLYLIAHQGFGMSVDELLQRAIDLDEGRIMEPRAPRRKKEEERE